VTAPEARPIDRRYRPGWPGVLYLATTLFLALGAINSQNNLLFWAFGLAISGLLISGVISGSGLLGLRVQRLNVPEGRVGEVLEVRYRLTNRNRFMSSNALTVRELDRARRGDEPASWARRVGAPSTFVDQVPHRGSTTVTAPCRCIRRGEGELCIISISSTFPFGLIRKSVLWQQDSRFVVLPARVELASALCARVRVAGEAGTQVSTRIGMGDDFFGVREYVPGDSLRQIAWRASARVGSLVVRQTSAPAPLRLWVLLDLRGGHDWSQELAIAVASAFIRLACSQRYAVGLSVPGHGILLAPRPGEAQSAALERELAMIDAEREHDQRDTIPTRSLRRETFVVVHAGEQDGAIGPAGALHVSALRPERVVRESASLPESLLPDGASA